MTNLDRRVLPIHDPPRPSPHGLDANDPATKFPPIEPLRPPDGAPTSADDAHQLSAEDRMRVAIARQ